MAFCFCSLAQALSQSKSPEPVCTYYTWEWNSAAKRALNHRKVRKPRSALTEDEQDKNSKCTVCQEDQVTVEIKGLPTFQICKHYAEKVRAAVIAARNEGFEIESIIGYRVGKSKGPLDQKGFRTQFSNHSFGTAIDINQNQNGLYTNCRKFNPVNCRLIRGGPWRSDNAHSITPASPIYKQFSQLGWSWGGQLAGKQKDFMHFSLTGD